MPWLWIVFTVAASAGQAVRNAMQKELTATLGTVGATHVRFLFGLPFALLFLAMVLTATGLPVPELNAVTLAWTVTGAFTQVAATALLLAVMQQRSFVVTTAYVKTEPVQVAVFGLAFLGDQVTPGLALAILIATAGVLIVSWPRSNSAEVFSWKPAALGIGSGALFAIAAIGYRGGIRALDTPSFVVAATVTLVLGLVIQTVMLSASHAFEGILVQPRPRQALHDERLDRPRDGAAIVASRVQVKTTLTAEVTNRSPWARRQPASNQLE